MLTVFFLSILWLSVTFFNFQPVDQFDWDQVFAYHELQRKIILDFHQFPLWNPYICGGEPWLAHPESDFLSPNFLLVLSLGTFRGIIAAHFLQVLIGMFGMYYLSRHFNLGVTLSLLNSVFFTAIYNVLTFVGGFASLNISLVPWVYLFFKRHGNVKKNLIYVSILFALLVYSGAYYVFIITFMIISIDAIYQFALQRRPAVLKNLFYVSLLFILLSSLKLFPMLDLIRTYPRYVKIPFTSFFSLSRFFNIVWISGSVDTLGRFWGVTIFILFILSIFLLWKRHTAIAIMNIVFLLLFLGNDSPVNLWRIWHFFIPSLKEHRIFLMPFFVTVSLSLGLAIKELQLRGYNSRNFRLSVYIILFPLLVYGVLADAKRTFANTRLIQYKINRPEAGFMQTSGDHRRMYESIVNNRGVVYGYDSIGNQIKTKVVPKENAGYKGEYFLVKDSGKIKNFTFSPNRLKFKLNFDNDDILVINQNYFPGWRSSKGRVFNFKGLIGIYLKPEDKELDVYYMPFCFILGMIAFACGVLSLGIYGRLKNKLGHRQGVGGSSGKFS